MPIKIASVRTASQKAYYHKNKSVILGKMKERYQKRKNTIEGKFLMYRSSCVQRWKKVKEWGLTLEQFSEFWQKPCYYCGDSIETIGLDRVDSEKGYVMGNVVSCCTPCNFGKNTASQKDFILRCKRIAERHAEVQ